jgi:hypothetical protein
MADGESLKQEMREQMRAQRERSERMEPHRTATIEMGAHPAHAEVRAVGEPARRGLLDRLLRR